MSVKKLIEVALPAGGNQRGIRPGKVHPPRAIPVTLHSVVGAAGLWRRHARSSGLALVDDPSSPPGPVPHGGSAARRSVERLFRHSGRGLVKWENSNDEARAGGGQGGDPEVHRRQSAGSCWTPLPAAAPFRWRRSGSGWRPMPTT